MTNSPGDSLQFESAVNCNMRCPISLTGNGTRIKIMTEGVVPPERDDVMRKKMIRAMKRLLCMICLGVLLGCFLSAPAKAYSAYALFPEIKAGSAKTAKILPAANDAPAGVLLALNAAASGGAITIEDPLPGNASGSGISVDPDKTFTVTFIMNNGENPVIQQVSLHGTAADPGAPVRNGYVFGGWYRDPHGFTAFRFTEEITGDTTVYATWIPFDYSSLTPENATGGAIYVQPDEEGKLPLPGGNGAGGAEGEGADGEGDDGEEEEEIVYYFEGFDDYTIDGIGRYSDEEEEPDWLGEDETMFMDFEDELDSVLGGRTIEVADAGTPAGGRSPKTGDGSAFWIWLMMIAGILCGLAGRFRMTGWTRQD